MPRATLLVLPLLVLASLASAQHELIERCGPDPSSGTSTAVVVPAAALVHTAQLLPTDAAGELVGKGEPKLQTLALLKSLDVCLAEFAADRRSLVKLNVYVADGAVATDVRRLFSETFDAASMPAVTFVETALPRAGAAVALDAVFAGAATTDGAAVLRRQSRRLAAEGRFAHLAVLPAGEAVYVSGQAEPADDLLEATRRSMQSLQRTLDHLGLGAEHVVQLKAFLVPMAAAAAVRREMAQFFEGALVPPISLVEWESGLPIEIELIAAVPAGQSRSGARETVAYVTPPAMTASPVFSRVARARGERTIYVSGLYARQDGDGEAQVRDLFGQLSGILEEAGSDLRHLVKATYYVSNDDASQKLNTVRPDFYDPARPPAASKAMVRGVGRKGRTITLDMIAVTPNAE